MKRVLVTGANGFVGRCLCERLSADGWQVCGTIRRAESCDALPSSFKRVVTGDLASFDGWEEALHGIDVVVHLVARTHVMRERSKDAMEQYRHVNVTGTRRLLESCLGTSVRRFVFISSIKAVGEGEEHAYRESDDCHPENPYGLSKREAEQLVLTTAPKLGVEPVILRPPLVYGPGVLGNFRRILKAIDRGVPLPLGRIRNQRSLLNVDNLAAAISVCLEHARAAGEVFHLADWQPVSTCELAKAMSRALGRRPRLLPAPVSVLRGLGRLTRKHDEVSRLVDSLTLSTEKIEQAIGWRPHVSLDEGLDATVRHYRAA